MTLALNLGGLTLLDKLYYWRRARLCLRLTLCLVSGAACVFATSAPSVSFNALTIKAGFQNKAQAHARATARCLRVSAPFPYPDFNTHCWTHKARHPLAVAVLLRTRGKGLGSGGERGRLAPCFAPWAVLAHWR